MTNIEKLKELMAEMERANASYSGCFPSQQATLDYELSERILLNGCVAMLPALIAVAEAAQLVSGDHNGPYLMSSQEKIQANEATLKKSLAELEGVKLP